IKHMYWYSNVVILKFCLQLHNFCEHSVCYYGQYELRLAASDNLKENYTTVVIHVKDVNDNPPVFERPTYRTQITEEDDRNLPKRVLQYELTLVASDSLNENQTTVVIHVNDVNDLPPVFNSTLYTAVMEEEFTGPHPYRLLQVIIR
ncbi:hypothetical protein L9F63_011698, partial [Diploptera punctata]